jgi:hypothetical protein
MAEVHVYETRPRVWTHNGEGAIETTDRREVILDAIRWIEENHTNVKVARDTLHVDLPYRLQKKFDALREAIESPLRRGRKLNLRLE